MRKIIVLSFITLDGVMQAPGGPEEDPSNDFKYGGWTAPYFDGSGEDDDIMAKQLQPADYLLGRKTYEIFAAYWPQHNDFWPSINENTKYVLSTTMHESDWPNTEFLQTVDHVKELKKTEGHDLQVHGSGEMIQLLLANDLVDELWLKTFPITLGQGKKLFGEGTIPAAFTLTESHVMSNGVIFANYARAGEVKTGTVGV